MDDKRLTIKTERVAEELSAARRYLQRLDALIDALIRRWLFPGELPARKRARHCPYCGGALHTNSYEHTVSCPITQSVAVRTPHLEE